MRSGAIWVFDSAPTSDLLAVWLFAATYLALTGLVANLLRSCALVLRRWSGAAVLSALSALRLRWLWALLLVNLAGLPPATFFGPKLGLLCALYGSGTLTVVGGLGLSVMLGWAAYFALGQRSLASNTAQLARPLRERALPTRVAFGASLAACMLLLGAPLLDDCVLLVA